MLRGQVCLHLLHFLITEFLFRIIIIILIVELFLSLGYYYENIFFLTKLELSVVKESSLTFVEAQTNRCKKI